MANAEATGDKMRVLYVHTATLAPLGADTWVHAQIIRHLDRSTHELYVACRRSVHGAPTPTYEAIRDVADVHIVPVDFGVELSGRSKVQKVWGLIATLPALLGIARLILLVRRRKIRLIHTSDRPRDAFAAVLIGRLTGATSVVHVHVGYNPQWMGRMLRWSIGHADVLIAVSEFVGRTLEDGGNARERIHVVLNAIDLDAWHPGQGGAEVRDELALDAATPLVTTVCRLFPEKGPAELIRAVAAVSADLPDVTLLIVGVPIHPAYGDELRALARSLGVDGRVQFLGRRSDVAAVMDAADVFAMPSHEEPFGLVFVEAMAMGRPVVALADGGTVEVVEHGTTGLLSTWGDVEQLTVNLRTLLEDPVLRASMGENGRRCAERRFTVQHMAARVADTYRLIAFSANRPG